MNYADNIMQVTDKLTGEMALIHFDVIPTLNTQMYDTYVGGVHVSEYNREDVLGDGRVSYTPAEGGEPARLTLRGATLSAGFCGRQDPAVYGKDAFAAIFTREDLEIIAEGSNVIVLDEFSDAPENAYVVGSLIAGIYGFGANVTLSGSGELIVKSRHGFWLAEDSGHNGGGLILNGGSLTTKVDNGNACRSFTYAGGRFCGFSAQNSEKALLNGLSFAGGTQEKTLLLLSAEPDGKNAQPGTPEMLASQQPGDLFRYVLIQPANRLAEEPEMLAGVNGETGELSVGVNKSVKGVSTMKAIVAVYDKATGRFQEMWMGDVNPIDPLTGTGLIYDEAKRYRIMVLDGDVWRPLADSEDV